TTRTPGTFYTQNVPVTLQRYTYHSSFWRRIKPGTFGASLLPLSPELKQKLERNGGVVIDLIRDGSPAFNANILEGDVILRFSGEEILTVSDLIEKCRSSQGRRIDLEVWRNGNIKLIPVHLNRIE